MTESEAIKKHIEQNNSRIENIKYFMSSNHDVNIDDCKRNIEILTISNKALEKQIQKKPDYEADGYADGQLVYDTWICPCCEKRYEVDYDNYDYCPNCGQKLDWSDEE